MAISTINADGLRRTFRVVVPAADLKAQLDAKLAEVAPKVQLKGFRTGKVPAGHVRKLFGAEIMRDVINEEVQRSTQKAIEEASVRLAAEPRLNLESDLTQVQAGAVDLAFSLEVDVMPDFEPADVRGIELEKLVAPVEEMQIQAMLEDIAKANRSFEPKDGPAADGDSLTIDFVGKVDGVAFEGGSAEGAELVLGSNQFIPGFEAQLVGASAGEERTINVTFPADYGAEQLKGKDATFDVVVKQVRAPKDTAVDADLAAKLGFDSLDDLQALVKSRLEREHASMTRAKAKRALFDKLDTLHDFALPPGMVEAEFDQIWRQVEADKASGQLDEEDAAKSEDDLKADYRRIAERRVRLGLVLAEIGRRNEVTIRDEEVAAAVGEQARRFPGSERQVFEFYQKNPNALAQIRAPIYEEKVVDFILELAKVSTRTVTRTELEADDEATPEAAPAKAMKRKSGKGSAES
jgi:trigger factor